MGVRVGSRIGVITSLIGRGVCIGVAIILLSAPVPFSLLLPILCVITLLLNFARHEQLHCLVDMQSHAIVDSHERTEDDVTTFAV